MSNHYPLRTLTKQVLLALVAISGMSGQVMADDKSTVTVTGSRIARTAVEGVSPVTTITAEDISRGGYQNVYDAIANTVQNSGFVQGEDFGNTFTPSATTVSLRGMGPNHTLVLLDGRRIAEFPVAYGGSVNFTNLANIPSNIIDRIEILSGGASAIYGSDAIAGVINIILKKSVNGYELRVKAGDTERGGGSNRQVQFSGGWSFDRFSTLLSAEYSDRSPLRATQRDFMATRVTPNASVYRRETSSGKYYDPGTACDDQASFFESSVIKYKVAKGSYCASNKLSPLHWTVRTQNQSLNLFSSSQFELNADTTIYADILLGKNKTENDTRSPSWTASTTNKGYFRNKNTGLLETWYKVFAPEEIGGLDPFQRRWEDQSTGINVGIKGKIPTTAWTYDLAFSHSQYKSANFNPRPLATIDTYILGPLLGKDANGNSIYAPDPANLFRKFTPTDYKNIYGESVSDDQSKTQNLSLALAGELFALPAGPLKTSLVAELGKQSFSNVPDPRINAGVFNTTAKSDTTQGDRTRYAIGTEVLVPVTSQVIASLAGRYDQYKFAGKSDGRATYSAGLEYRPTDTVLIRGSQASSFRAPDMNYIYKARGTGYYSSTTDYYLCEKSGTPLDKCDYANYSPGANYVQTGNPNLKSEHGKSQGLGIVWSPTKNFDVSVDYWKISLSDKITNISSDTILRQESHCRTGKADIKSGLCADALSRVVRNPADAISKPGEIFEIRTNPINAAFEESSGVDVTARYRWKTETLGDWSLSGNYSKTLTKKSAEFAGDNLYDELASLSEFIWRDKLVATLNWKKGDWSHTVTALRYGKIPNQAEKFFLSPGGQINWNVTYTASPKLSFSLSINNVLDKIKNDFSSWPNYPVGAYSPIGRQGWLEVRYKFGS